MSSSPASLPTTFRDWYQWYQQTEDQRSVRVWGLSGAAMTVLTGVALWWAVTHAPPQVAAPSAAPPPAIAIDMSPMPTPAPAPPQDVDPGPQQMVTPPEPQPDTPQQVDAPPSPAPHPPVPVPKVEKVKVHKKTAKSPPQPVKPVPMQAPVADKMTAPPAADSTPSQSSTAASASHASHSSNAPVTWQGDILARLERFKRYPADALAQHQEGTPVLFFVMDRRGHVLSAKIRKSGGFALLDEETLAVVRRAEPFPPPPEEIAGATVSLTVPIEFSVENQ